MDTASQTLAVVADFFHDAERDDLVAEVNDIRIMGEYGDDAGAYMRAFNLKRAQDNPNYADQFQAIQDAFDG